MDALKLLRKKTNALRGRYRLSLHNEELREISKNQYIEGIKKNQAEIRKEKINSWNQYCNITSLTNP